MARGGPCAELSSRSDDRALSRAFVMLERRAVKVACVVLRGLGEGDLAWLPGGLHKLNNEISPAFCRSPQGVNMSQKKCKYFAAKTD